MKVLVNRYFGTVHLKNFINNQSLSGLSWREQLNEWFVVLDIFNI